MIIMVRDSVWNITDFDLLNPLSFIQNLYYIKLELRTWNLRVFIT